MADSFFPPTQRPGETAEDYRARIDRMLRVATAAFYPPAPYPGEPAADYEKRLDEARRAYEKAKAEARAAGRAGEKAFQRSIPRGSTLLFETAEKGSPEEGPRLPAPKSAEKRSDLFERASRGPASSLPYGKQTDQPVADLEKAKRQADRLADEARRKQEAALKKGLWDGREETMPMDIRQALARYRMKVDEVDRLEKYLKSSGGLPGLVRPGTSSEIKEVEKIIINPDGSITKSTGLVARGGGEVVLPPSQKYSSVKREFDRSQRMSYADAVAYYRSQGYSEADAKRYAGELLDAYEKTEIGRREVEAIARRPQTPVTTVIESESVVQELPGVLIRRGTGAEARSGTEVAREFLNAERRVQQSMAEQRREQDKRGRGLPTVLTRTGRSVFTESESTFEPIQEGRARRYKQKGKTVTTGLTRAQAKDVLASQRQERERVEESTGYEFFKAQFGPETKPQRVVERRGGRLVPMSPEEAAKIERKVERSALPEGRRFERTATEREAWLREPESKKAPSPKPEPKSAQETREAAARRAAFIRDYEKRTEQRLDLNRYAVVETEKGFQVVLRGRRPLGALDTKTGIMGLITIGLIVAGGVMIYRAVQADKKAA